jgi:hypothetical protein
MNLNSHFKTVIVFKDDTSMAVEQIDDIRVESDLLWLHPMVKGGEDYYFPLSSIKFIRRKLIKGEEAK